MSDTLHFLKALADETRLRLLNVLNRYELNVNELMTIMDMGQSRISRHLKILSSAALLAWRRDGLWVFYRVADSGAGRDFADAVLPFVAEGELFRADLGMAAGVIEERSRSTRTFFNAIAEDWDQLSRDILGDFDLPRAVAAFLPPDAVAVDLGCGTGHVLEAMLPRASEVIGVDGSARMLELARRRFAADASRVSLRIGDLEHLPLRDREADFISINMVLHHLSTPAAALEEARRVLRPGGTLVVTDFDRHDNESMRSAYGDRWLGFSAGALADAIAGAGFVLLDCEKKAVEKGLRIHIARAGLPG
jgi:ArsR family transcriptional regulator